MHPVNDLPRRQHDISGPGRPPPDPLIIAQEILGELQKRAYWILAVTLVLVTIYAAVNLWPEPTVQAEVGFTPLQDLVIRGAVESITISGTEAEGRFHNTVGAHDGRVVGISEPMPDGAYPSDDLDQANAFTATIPESARESFIGLLERQGVDVQVEPGD